MRASFEYELSKDDYLRGLQATTRSIAAENRNRKRQVFEQVAALALIFVIASLLNPGASQAVVVTALLTLVGCCVVQLRFARHWREITFDPARSRIEVNLDEQGLVVLQGAAERRYAWSELRRIHDLQEALVLEFADWHAVSMPNALWANPAERAEFVEHIRSSARQILPDLPKVGALQGLTLLLLLGAVAIGLVAMITLETWVRFAGFNDCSCAFRHSLIGQLLGLLPFVGYFVATALGWLGLRWLSRQWPRFAAAMAALFIALFVVSQAGPAVLQIYRLFNPPAP